MTEAVSNPMLAPCPFCGATPHRGLTKPYPDQLHGDLLQHYRIWCSHGCASKRAVNEELAIKAWNTRVVASDHVRDEPVAWLKTFAKIKRIALDAKAEDIQDALAHIVRLCIDAGAASPAKRNWPEDATHENGNYENRCMECDQSFIGHKRRVICKACLNLLTPSPDRPASDQGAVREAREALEALSLWVQCERQRYRRAGGIPAGGFDNMTPIEIALAKVESEIDRRAALSTPAIGTPDVREALEKIKIIFDGYADSYRMMANDGDGRVMAVNVRTDLLCNILPAVQAALALPAPGQRGEDGK